MKYVSTLCDNITVVSCDVLWMRMMMMMIINDYNKDYHHNTNHDAFEDDKNTDVVEN